MTITSWRRCALVAAVMGALAVPSSAAAAVETFHRFEANAVANYTITHTCADGTTPITRVLVIGGFEEETEDGVTESDEFLTVNFRGSDCAGSFNDFGTGDAEFEFSPSLQEASVTGTITTFGGRVVTVDMSWEGTGPVEVDSNTTIRPGFTGHFVEKERDAVATGTVVVNGQTLVDGSTTNAFIRTFEDTNTTTGQA
jgi:hypothetical protein